MNRDSVTYKKNMQTNIHVIGVPEERREERKLFLNNDHKFSKSSEKYKSLDTRNSRNPKLNKPKENHT